MTRLAKIGAGLMGEDHASIVARNLPGARLQVVCDMNADRAKAVATTFGALGRALMMHNFHRNVETPAADFTGAMAIKNSAPHEFEMRHVLNTEFTSITAQQPRRSDSRVAPVVMVLETCDGQLVSIEVNNDAAYGYDVRAELVGEAGSVAMNAVVYTRTERKLASSTRYDADWRGRYHEAYVRQNRDFLRFVESGTFPAIASCSWDGYAAAVVAEAGAKALTMGQKQPISMMERPAFYAGIKGVAA